MIDREKVIKGLEEFTADLKPFAGNHADWQKVDDALKLLKADQYYLVKQSEEIKALCETLDKMQQPSQIGGFHV